MHENLETSLIYQTVPLSLVLNGTCHTRFFSQTAACTKQNGLKLILKEWTFFSSLSRQAEIQNSTFIELFHSHYLTSHPFEILKISNHQKIICVSIFFMQIVVQKVMIFFVGGSSIFLIVDDVYIKCRDIFFIMQTFLYTNLSGLKAQYIRNTLRP